jgi:hypothetical protein
MKFRSCSWFQRSAWEPTLLTLCVLVLASLVPIESHAQSFAFSVGSGGRCHHHGGWWAGYSVGPYWGPGWGPGWYGPPAVVYAAPPVVQPPVVYVQPQTVTVPPPPATSPYTTSAAPAPNSLAANTPPSFAGTSGGDDRIVIRNMAGAKLPVSFLVDGQDVELADGGVRTFVGKSHRTIQYDRGGRFGSTQQDIAGGQYEFRITSTGWDLIRKADAFTPTTRTAVRTNSLPDTAASR